MNFYTLTLWTHIAAGTTALLGFWLNAALPKGSALHSRVGQGYLLTMAVVTGTATLLAWHAFSNGEPVTGLFLAYLVVITVTPAWLAWRAIRDKRDFTAFTGRAYKLLAVLSIASGLVVLAAGLRYSVALLAGFSLVGVVSGAVMLRFAARRTAQPRWWLREHYFAIAGCGVATHIAFLNIGASRLLPSGWSGATQAFGWFVPVLVAVVARIWLDRKYGFARTAAPRAANLA
jgi:hypothetical protein